MKNKKIYNKKEMRALLEECGYTLKKNKGSAQIWENPKTKEVLKLHWSNDNAFMATIAKRLIQQSEAIW